MLKLTQREASIGPSINTRTERHGDENVAALDIPITFLVDAVELCALARSSEAAHRLFLPVAGKSNELDQPALPGFKAFVLADKIESCAVTLMFETTAEKPIELKLVDATLSKVRLTPKFAGRTQVDCTVQTAPDFDDELLELFMHMNGVCQLTVENEGWNAQAEMAV